MNATRKVLYGLGKAFAKELAKQAMVHGPRIAEKGIRKLKEIHKTKRNIKQFRSFI